MDLILYNPISKNSRGNVQTHKLIKYYKKHKHPFRLKSILKIDDIKSYLDERDEFDKVILLGGDGTINHLANQLVNYPNKPIIHLKKNGSGNDFLRTLKHQDQDPQYVIQNTLDDGSTHYFMNGTGIGLDGLVIDYLDSAKNKRKLSYFIASYKGMVNFVPEPLKITLDGTDYHFDKAYTLIINNGMYVGGGMKMTKEACLNNEELDILVVHRIPKIFLMFIFISVYFGLHTKFKKYVFSKKAKHIKGTFTTPQIVQMDGEKYLDVTSIDVKSTGNTLFFKQYQ
jgi:diacylglycerol kinase family enzyme